MNGTSKDSMHQKIRSRLRDDPGVLYWQRFHQAVVLCRPLLVVCGTTKSCTYGASNETGWRGKSRLSRLKHTSQQIHLHREDRAIFVNSTKGK